MNESIYIGELEDMRAGKGGIIIESRHTTKCVVVRLRLSHDRRRSLPRRLAHHTVLAVFCRRVDQARSPDHR